MVVTLHSRLETIKVSRYHTMLRFGCHGLTMYMHHLTLLPSHTSAKAATCRCHTGAERSDAVLTSAAEEALKSAVYDGASSSSHRGGPAHVLLAYLEQPFTDLRIATYRQACCCSCCIFATTSLISGFICRAWFKDHSCCTIHGRWQQLTLEYMLNSLCK